MILSSLIVGGLAATGFAAALPQRYVRYNILQAAI
jgi:hypothetical protein